MLLQLPLLLLLLLLLLCAYTTQAWCKENGLSEDLSSIADAPKAGRFLQAWCKDKWVSGCVQHSSTVTVTSLQFFGLQGMASEYILQPKCISMRLPLPCLCVCVGGGGTELATDAQADTEHNNQYGTLQASADVLQCDIYVMMVATDHAATGPEGEPQAAQRGEAPGLHECACSLGVLGQHLLC